MRSSTRNCKLNKHKIRTVATIHFMIIKVKFFGRCRHAVGKEEIEAEIDDGDSVATLCLKLAADFPSLEDHFHTLIFAVNAQQADWEFTLSEGDEVHFMSTLGGG
mgnify:CR=1 FL=1